MLEQLNQVAGQELPGEYIESHFQHVQELFKKELGSWSLEQHLAFLFYRLLITSKDNVYHVIYLDR